ncbi:hypothetical protein Nepgr_001768 [Nepenthes gracilis]|uniref:Polygalacturonase n=1 Tax=Nepenthes gracilis TaxID=150966 RepID=A0AAD3RX92_NEPGR|nr:hypothetical protein Nepgr_001768 [Nepenthes gracilis]
MAKLTFFLLPFAFFHLSSSDGPSLNVVSFGANGDGVTDSTQAFLSAWESACNMSIPAEIYVPMGNYLLNPVIFKGDCMGPHLTMTINGTLVGPTDYNLIAQAASWIEFHGVDGLSINGGLLDARGQYLWDCKANGGDCPFGGRSLSLGNSNNIVITNLTSINSQMFHVSINECQNVTLLGLTIWADGESPNTDGIHIENSIGLNILHSPIQTGDDCISAGPGTQNLWIEDVSCGPGHGISIGSLGAEEDEEGVLNVTAKNVSFNGTQNGLRIKTWARPSNAFVQDVHFEGGVMYNVSNPIIIDQNYCPSRNCAYDQSLSLGNSNNVVITNLTSINSQMFHVSINECQNVTLLGLTIWADGDSPNTDGIHIENSIGLNILHSPIQTGDDCISAGPGTQNLWIEDVSCGPGHGISIGSLGAEEDEEGVRNVTAKNVSFNGTENGLRIKTWARPSNAFVQDVHFEGSVMYNVSNPIIIDQNYCPSRNCAYDQGIHGTTVSAIAMRFNCSSENPCTGLLLEDVQLTGESQWPQSSCENAYGLAIGSVQPESCLQLLINP